MIPFHKQTDPKKQAGQVVFCSCGDREKSQCPGEWEKGCDLGANPNHATISTAWFPAPRSTEWGEGMMEALLPLGPDETLRVYAHKNATPAADALLAAVRQFRAEAERTS